MMIAVTGSSGLLGRATVDRLRADGHDVLGLDLAGTPGEGFTRVDLSDYGQVLDSLLGVTARHSGLDAVVHLAAIPVNGLVPDAATFHNNMTVSFNVMFGALRAGIRTIVYASSITAMGFPFGEAPDSLPVDEAATAANNTYGLGKVRPCATRMSSPRTATPRSSARAIRPTAGISSAATLMPATAPSPCRSRSSTRAPASRSSTSPRPTRA